MKVLEKALRLHTGGGCELSSITFEHEENIYIALYTNCDGYSLYKGTKTFVNNLKNTKDLLSDYFIEGNCKYYDLVTVDSEIASKFDYIEGNYDEPTDEYDNDSVEKFLLKKINEYLSK